MIYNKNLVAIRNRIGLSQTELAHKLNIDRTSYWHFENEDDIMPLKYLIIITEIFNTSLDYLFNFTNIKQYPNNKFIVNNTEAGKRLKEIRKENHHTQCNFSKIIHVDTSLISKYESGKNPISTTVLYDICKKYKVSADYLLGKTNEPKYLK